jgi:hypothetical protein
MPSENTARIQDYVRNMELSPRVKLATRLWASGACKTQKEAAQAAGIHPMYMSLVKRENPRMTELINQIDKEIQDGTIDMSKVLLTLGRRAVRNLAHLAENAEKEDIRFRANVDLADRSPETVKTHKVQAEGTMQLRPEDVTALTHALVESARLRAKFPEAAIGDFIRVEDPQLALPPSSNGDTPHELEQELRVEGGVRQSESGISQHDG